MKKALCVLIFSSIALAVPNNNNSNNNIPNKDAYLSKQSALFLIERMNYIIRLAEIDKAQANEKLMALIGQENQITQNIVVKTKELSKKPPKKLNQNIVFPKIQLIKVYK